MLRAAGHEGFQTVLWTRTEETALRLAQSYQQDLATIGVHARIKNLSWASFLEAIETPALVPMFMLAWQADFPDPSNFLEVLFHSKNIGANNYSFFADGAVDQLLDTAAATIDPAARLARLSEAHRLILAHAPWVLLYHPTTYEVIHPRVAGYRLHPLRPPRYEEVELRY
jgi:peptide/nickel transport system substrate-binding protein/oligopeptide transport system substrate-binding protein